MMNQIKYKKQYINNIKFLKNTIFVCCLQVQQQYPQLNTLNNGQ